MKPTFLSIDLDYWLCPDHEDEEPNFSQPGYDGAAALALVPQMLRFLLRLYDTGVPIHVVGPHHELLPYIDACPARRLVNMDFHSDLAKNNEAPINCGTWASHVAWRAEGSFVWSRPRGVCVELGRCDSEEHRPFSILRATNNWGSLREQTAIPSLKGVVEAGISLDREYISRAVRRVLYDLLAIFDRDPIQTFIEKPRVVRLQKKQLRK